MYIASEYETIIFEVKDSIGYLTINREAKLQDLMVVLVSSKSKQGK